jgi:hypothetical protein
MIGVPNQLPSNFYGAGCAFTDRNKILAGTSFKPLGDIRMSGFGGKRKGCETAEETAWREVLEELFDWKAEEIPDSLLAFCFTLEPIGCLEKKGYICFVFSFTQLEEILTHIEIPSPLYSKIPRTLGELVFDRKFIPRSPFENCPEISQIVVLSLYRQSVDIEFYDDIIEIYDRLARKV